MPAAEVLCVGELLWDSLPGGLFLGGAPFNVACHLVAAGVPAAIVSSVGVDRLGEEAMRRAVMYGVATDLVQIDPVRATGFVTATLDERGNARYEILENVAWDAIAVTDALRARAAAARAIVFGSLAQRADVTRSSIGHLCASPALKVFDVNLRPPYEDPDVVRASLARADVVKANETEMERMAAWFGLPHGARASAKALADAFSCSVVVVTRGANGAGIWRNAQWTEHPGFTAKVRDTVGAGDAFLAVLLSGLLSHADNATLLERANRAGAAVASRIGALPDPVARRQAPSAG